MKPKSPAAGAWANYEFAPAFVLGFHGCDATTGEAILRGEIPHLNASEHDYDNREWFHNVREARVLAESYRRYYNQERPHSSLGYKTPFEFQASICALVARGGSCY